MAGDRPDWLDAVDTVADEITPSLSAVPANSFNINVTANKSYRSLLLGFATPGVTDRSNFVVQVKDAAGVLMQSTSFNRFVGVGGQNPIAIPLPVVVNGTVNIAVTQNSGTIKPSSATLWGLTTETVPKQLLRPDLLPYPTVNNIAHFGNSANGALIAAPGVGARILLKRACLNSGVVASSTVEIQLQVTINTVLGVLLFVTMVTGAGPNAAPDRDTFSSESGLLLDYNTPVSVVFGAGSGLAYTLFPEATALYDVVG